jgi:hypothetical protein
MLTREASQLAVGHVQEVGPADQCHQPVPGVDVGDVVVGVAVHGPVGDRHRPIRGHRQDPHQLLQVRPVILAMAMRDRGGGLAPARASVRRRVGARELDRRRVVVQLGDVKAEAVDRAQHQPRQ